MKDRGGIYERTALLVGEEGVEKLKRSSVLIAGLGGVGGYIAEALARAGIGRLGLCDFDTIDETNLNRQILALGSNIGEKKTEAAKKRLLDINPDLSLELFDMKLSSENIGMLNISSWDAVCDAIDDVPAKTELLSAAYHAGVFAISSMGTGNKLDPFAFRIAPIEKTSVCPLARVMRRALKERGVSCAALYSVEEPVISAAERSAMPSISYVPSCAGLMIAGAAIENLLKKP